MKTVKRIIDSVDMEGKYFHVRASGINYRYITQGEILSFIAKIIYENMLTYVKKRLNYTNVFGEK